MPSKRRRGNPSDWVLALKASRSAKKLRRNLPSSIEFATISTVSHGPPETHSPEPSHNPPQSRQLVPSTDVMHKVSLEEIVADASGWSNPPDRDEGVNDSIPELDASDQEHDSQIEDQNNDDTSNHDSCASPLNMQYFELSQGIVANAEEVNGNDANDDRGFQSCSEHQERMRAFDNTCDRGNRLCADRLPDLEALTLRRAKWNKRLNLTALIAVIGSVRFTVQQYEYTRDILEGLAQSSGDKWPPYSKTQMYFKDIVKHCLPSSHLVRFPKSDAKNASTAMGPRGVDVDPALDPLNSVTQLAPDHTESECVRVFLPSAWARLDVCTSVVYDAMYPCFPDAVTNSIEIYPIVKDRKSVASVSDFIFIKYRGKCVPCGPDTVVQIAIQHEVPQFRTPYCFCSEDGCYKFTAVIVATWCVGAVGHPNVSFERALRSCTFSLCQRKIAQSLSVAGSRPDVLSSASELPSVLPGDICTILKTDRTESEDEYHAVLVHRFWRFEEGTPSMLLCWVRLTENSLPSSIIETKDVHAIKDLTLRRLSNQVETTPAEQASRGHLADGTPYVVYRILLYCDDFQRSSQNYPRGSAGGCYFLPQSLPPEKRRTVSSVRVISLTPPGVSTNQVLQYVIDDLVYATTRGIEGRTPDGSPVKISIDVVGFVGDYPAAAATVDVLGHVSRAPCTLCTFRRHHNSITEGSKYGYTTDVHAGNSSFLRHAERDISLREASLSAMDANFLGMVDSARQRRRPSPLMHLYQAMKSRKHLIPLTNAGKTVVPGLFDPYRCNVIAPDHLLTGLSKDVINTVFLCVPNAEMRAHADIYICSSLKENGLLPQRSVYN